MTASGRHARAMGFSLIELMVAMTMGLFLLAGLVAVVFSMRKSFTSQDGMTLVQENTRFMLTVMGTTVHNAGYFTDTLNQTVLTALPVPAAANSDGSTFAAGQFISGTTGSGTASDTLNVRFQTASGDGLMNCTGGTNTSGANAIYTNSFAVNAAGEMTCAVGVNGVLPAATPVLVEHIASMKMLFSVDTDGDGAADSYRNATAITAAGQWDAVNAVQLTFTLRDMVNSKPGAPVNLPKPLFHTINLMNKGS